MLIWSSGQRLIKSLKWSVGGVALCYVPYKSSSRMRNRALSTKTPENKTTMGNEANLESASTCDTDLAIHPDLDVDTNLPQPPPPPSFSPISASSCSPKQGKNRLNISSPSSPKSGRRNEPVGLTVDIDSSGSPCRGKRSGAPPLNAPGGGTMMPVEVDLEIEDGTPAAEALRANADVKVTKVGKAARFLHVQNVRKSAKKILHVGTGVKRGKPPRIPGTTQDAIGHGEEEQDDEIMRQDNGNLDILPEDPNEDEMQSYESVFDENDGQPQILKSQSSDSSDAGVPSKIAVFESQPSSLMLLDAKGKKQEVLLDRKMKKKMKKPKKKKPKRNYVKGKVIDGKHELYTLSIAMMLGLRYSIFLTNNQILKDRKNGRMWLDSDEFMKVEKYIFRPDGGSNTPPHQLSHTFKFKDYSPLPFAFIRRMFGINEYEFHHSVCGNANFIEFISNAKSGQFFFYSSDGKYMIKTMTNAESKFLRRSKSEIPFILSLVNLANPIKTHTALLFSSNASSTSLFSALFAESKHNSDKVSRDVSCEAVSSPQKCKICHHELCL